LGTPNAQFPPASNISIDSDSGSTKMVFIGHPTSSLSILFGESEYYSLDLIYQLDNPTLSAADTELALPPDTPYQRVLLDQLDPTPRTIKSDADGNWLAVYPLVSKQQLEVKAQLFAEVFALPQTNSELVNPKSLTTAQPYWEVTDQQVLDLSSQLKTPNNIYDYLVGHFAYDHGRAAGMGCATGRVW